MSHAYSDERENRTISRILSFQKTLFYEGKGKDEGAITGKDGQKKLCLTCFTRYELYSEEQSKALFDHSASVPYY
jgi:hypothetical protein